MHQLLVSTLTIIVFIPAALVPAVSVQPKSLPVASEHLVPELYATCSSGNTMLILPTEVILWVHENTIVYIALVRPTVNTEVSLTAEVTVHVPATVVNYAAVSV